MKTIILTAILTCTVQVFFAQGEIADKTAVKNSTEVVSQYDEEGNLETTVEMKNGMADGTLTVYYDNGSVKETREYVKGDLHGTCYRYSEEGEILAVAEYEHNVKSGTWVVYNPQNQQKITFMYVDGKKVGVSYKYDSEGKVIAAKLF